MNQFVCYILSCSLCADEQWCQTVAADVACSLTALKMHASVVSGPQRSPVTRCNPHWAAAVEQGL